MARRLDTFFTGRLMRRSVQMSFSKLKSRLHWTEPCLRDRSKILLQDNTQPYVARVTRYKLTIGLRGALWSHVLSSSDIFICSEVSGSLRQGKTIESSVHVQNSVHTLGQNSLWIFLCRILYITCEQDHRLLPKRKFCVACSLALFCEYKSGLDAWQYWISKYWTWIKLWQWNSDL